MKTRLADINRYFENLPPSRPEAEIRAEYGDRIRDGLDRFAAATAGRRAAAAVAAAFDATLVLVRDVRESLLKVAECGANVVAALSDAFAPPAAFSPVYARGADDGAAAALVEAKGEGCCLRASVGAGADAVDLSLDFLDGGGSRISPFTLSVIDADTGKTLVDERVFSLGAATLAGVERGRYALTATGAGRSCTLTLAIK